MEAENRGEGETLTRHKKILCGFAQKKGLFVGEVYREIVSGETIASRPQMQRLLNDVEQRKWEGIIVMEVERLCRGNSIDQGIVAQAFKESNTLIITPQKTYDPDNEADEEYFEFSLFMSRREYKTIKRRLAAGRSAAAAEGKFIGNIAPYGYVKVKTEQGCTLRIDENEAKILKNIFIWYVNGAKEKNGRTAPLGIYAIAKHLNTMHIPSKKGGTWSSSTIRDILKNPVYIGKIRTGYYKQSVSISGDKRVLHRNLCPSSCKTVDGLHYPIISDELFFAAQKRLTEKDKQPMPIKQNSIPKNPFAGIIMCGKCGKCMVRRENKNRCSPSLICTHGGCNNISSYFNIVQQQIFTELDAYFDGCIFNIAPYTAQMDADAELLAALENELLKCSRIRSRLFELAEREIYSNHEYVERRKALDEKVKALISARNNALDCISKNKTPAVSHHSSVSFRDAMLSIEDIGLKNRFLKCLIKKIIYTKQEKGVCYRLDLFPLIPESAKILTDRQTI
ncbi:MAG: recombinase family protein [Clostridia bacterium]|nr:recombinase family protein [Clostridia bacterium]